MPRTTSCAMALSVSCDSTQENQAKFREIFETALRGLRELSGAEGHDSGNAQFYGGIDFANGDLYIHERDVAAVQPEPATPTASGLKKVGGG